MGCCSSKYKLSEPDYNGYGSGMPPSRPTQPTYQQEVQFQKVSVPQTQVPQTRQSQQQQPRPQPIPTPLKSSPASTRPVQIGQETILGKPLENIKQYYTLGKELGRGQFGITYLCTENSTGNTYACKSILKRKLKNKDRKSVV